MTTPPPLSLSPSLFSHPSLSTGADLPLPPLRSPFSISLSCHGWLLVASHLPISSLHGLHLAASTSPSLSLSLSLFISLVSPSLIGEHATVPSNDAAYIPSLSLFLFIVSPCFALSSPSSSIDLFHFSRLYCLLHPSHHPSPLPWPSSPSVTSHVFSFPPLAHHRRHDHIVAFLLFDVREKKGRGRMRVR